MKATGIVRRLDHLGRIVIPKEVRRTHCIDEKDSLEIFVDKDGEIILKKYEPACIICGGTKKMGVFKGNNICEKCFFEIRSTDTLSLKY